MKKTLFLTFLACNILQMRAQQSTRTDYYDLKSYSVDSVTIEIDSPFDGYNILFSIDKNRMKCRINGIFTHQEIEYKLKDDSVETYNFLKEYIIEHKKERYISKRKSDKYWYICEEPFMALRIYIKNNYFYRRLFWWSDTKTDKEDIIGDEIFLYSEPFKHFINSWEEKAVNVLGGEILERYKIHRNH